jgi:hypothetical protein
MVKKVIWVWLLMHEQGVSSTLLQEKESLEEFTAECSQKGCRITSGPPRQIQEGWALFEIY